MQLQLKGCSVPDFWFILGKVFAREARQVSVSQQNYIQQAITLRQGPLLTIRQCGDLFQTLFTTLWLLECKRIDL